jgi:hypothetical protein
MGKQFSVFLLLLLACETPCVAQADVDPAVLTPKAPDDVKSMVAGAYEQNAIASISAPYHMLATFQTFTSDGRPEGDGTIERFAATPDRMNTVITFRGHTMTEFAAERKLLYTDDGFSGNIMLYFAEARVG